MFYKAYQRSAYLLCKYIHPFKVSSRIIKDIQIYGYNSIIVISSYDLTYSPKRR